MGTVISFVIDDHPKFMMQGWNLIHSLIASATFPSPGVELLIHHTKQVDRKRLENFQLLGAKLIEIDPFGTDKAVYCNKLRQLESTDVLCADHVILLDADVMPLSSLAPLHLSNFSVQAKIVDAPNPPEPVLRSLFATAGFDPKIVETGQPSLFPTETTMKTNCNGGLYVLSNIAVQRLRFSWPKWARFCLEREDILDRWIHHSDQLGFTLAMTEAGLNFQPLDISDNFPTHFPRQTYDDILEEKIRLVHYHDRMDIHGLPSLTGISWIDKQIALMNDKIRDLRCSCFDDRIFCDFVDSIY